MFASGAGPRRAGQPPIIRRRREPAGKGSGQLDTPADGQHPLVQEAVPEALAPLDEGRLAAREDEHGAQAGLAPVGVRVVGVEHDRRVVGVAGEPDRQRPGGIGEFVPPAQPSEIEPMWMADRGSPLTMGNLLQEAPPSWLRCSPPAAIQRC